MMKGMAQSKGGMDEFTNEEYNKKKKMKEREEEKRLMASIYGGAVAATETKANREAIKKNPKLKICPFFKAGVCEKGRKCKFSHDMNKDAKTGSANLYIDARDTAFKKKGGMDGWNQDTLEEAVNKNEGQYKKATTEKVCKFFLTAVEKKNYGWFWVCPNGHSCIYRHCLPPGFVLAADLAKADEIVDETPLEEKLDDEVKALHLSKKKLTPVTLENFLVWKKKRLERQNKEREAKRLEHLKALGHKKKINKLLDGRSMFVFQKVVIVDDDDAADEIERETSENEEDDIKVHNLDDYIVRAPAKKKEEKKVEEVIPEEPVAEAEAEAEVQVQKEEEKTPEGEEANVDIDEDAFGEEDMGDLNDGDDIEGIED